MQIESYLNDNEIQNQELLTLDTISPIWAKKLEESKLLPVLSLRRLRLYVELKYFKVCSWRSIWFFVIICIEL